jgi:hypothetical protein
MSENLSPLEMISANADLVVSVAQDELGRDVGFDADGVRWLDSYIQRLHDQGGVDEPEILCDRLGSYLGSCIAQSYGGTWQEMEQGWAVVVDGDLAVFPFNKSYKHLLEGSGDSVLALFNTIPAMIAHAKAGQAEQSPTDAGAHSLKGRISRIFRHN